MTQEVFTEAVTDMITHSYKTLVVKGKEYAPDMDRLIAFKHAASLTGETTQLALRGMLNKHIASIYQMCEMKDPSFFSDDTWKEKIGDAINYLLLYAVIKEQTDV